MARGEVKTLYFADGTPVSAATQVSSTSSFSVTMSGSEKTKTVPVGFDDARNCIWMLCDPSGVQLPATKITPGINSVQLDSQFDWPAGTYTLKGV